MAQYGNRLSRKQWISFGFQKTLESLSGYYKCTYMRFSNAKYSTNCQKLNIDIMMGCVISPLIFVLVMQMLLRSTNGTTSKKTVPSMKAFMDDVTVISESKSKHGKIVESPTGAFQVGSHEDKDF